MSYQEVVVHIYSSKLATINIVIKNLSSLFMGIIGEIKNLDLYNIIVNMKSVNFLLWVGLVDKLIRRRPYRRLSLKLD